MKFFQTQNFISFFYFSLVRVGGFFQLYYQLNLSINATDEIADGQIRYRNDFASGNDLKL